MRTARGILVVPVFLFALTSTWAQVVPFIGPEPTTRTAFITAAPNAVNVIDFENHSGNEGFLPEFTEVGFVTFHLTTNYNHEVIDGFNVGQSGNKIYTTIAINKLDTIADITFGNGVMAIGFDLKNTANGGAAISQTFEASVFSGTTLQGVFPISSVVGGTAFEFAGFVSTNAPITRITFISTGVIPNLDIILDNFALSNELEFRIADIHAEGNNVRITWNMPAGKTNYLQRAFGTATGSYSNNFTDLAGPYVAPGNGQASTNFVDTNIASSPARYYRVRLTP